MSLTIAEHDELVRRVVDDGWTPRARPLTQQSWREQAGCRDADPLLFDGERPDLTAIALRICRDACPVRTQCRDEARREHLSFTVRGGELLPAASR